MVKTYAVNCNDAWLNTKGDDISGSYVKYEDYAEIERRLLAAEAQEPVGFLIRDKYTPGGYFSHKNSTVNISQEDICEHEVSATPLYAAPPVAQPVAQPVQVPDGWKLVPVVPTREMHEAFHVAHEEAESGDCNMWVPDHHWQAMLAAAPRPGNE